MQDPDAVLAKTAPHQKKKKKRIPQQTKAFKKIIE
jgi:hypothetical protein